MNYRISDREKGKITSKPRSRKSKKLQKDIVSTDLVVAPTGRTAKGFPNVSAISLLKTLRPLLLDKARSGIFSNS